MRGIVRFGGFLPKDLLQKFNREIKNRKYGTRSGATRDAYLIRGR